MVAEKVLVSGIGHGPFIYFPARRERNTRTFEGVEINFVKLTISYCQLFCFGAPMKFLGV